MASIRAVRRRWLPGALIDTWDSAVFPSAVFELLALDLPVVYWNFIALVGGMVATLAELMTVDPATLRADVWM